MQTATDNGVSWGTASIPGGATSDHVVFAKNSFGWDLGRGLVFPPPTNPARVLGRELAVPGAWEGVAGEVQRWEGPLVPG